MEILTHRDRRGNVWRFGIDCTRPQYDIIRRMLATVRRTGNGAALSLSGLFDVQETAELCADVEAAMLRGLAERFPAPDDYRPPIGEQAAGEHSPAPVPEAADENPGRYWWENL